MRRLLLPSAAVLLAVGVFALPAAGAAPAAAAPRALCDVNDEKLPEITGITSVPGGFVAVTKKPTALRLYKLDAACKPSRILNDPQVTPRSIQDLARTPDGTLWVADIGDLDRDRDTIAIDKVAPNAKKATKFRLTYPDGKHDAAALIVAPNGVPVVITREADGHSKIYTTAGPLASAGANTPMKAVGTFVVPKSSTPGGKFGKVSQSLVSGAALSPDGKRIVVRTLTDAYEWDVDGDIAALLASGKAPRPTPLPNEIEGESITYTSDGAGFVTALQSPPNALHEWSPAPLPDPASPVKANAAAKASGGKAGFLDSLTFSQISGIIIGVGLVGLLMLVGGIIGIVRFRRRADTDEPSLDARLADARARSQGFPDDAVAPEPTMAIPPVGAAMPAGAGTVYGGGADQAPRGGTVYGGRPEAEPQRGGTVYGGGAANGTTYGAGPAAPTRGTTYGGGAPNGTTYGSGGTTYGSGPAAPTRGTTYGGAAPEASGSRQGQVYGRPAAPPPGPPGPPPGPVPGAAGRPPAAPAGGHGGTVYGDRSAGVADGRSNSDAIHEVPPRSPRDWRSRRPPD